MIDVGSTASTSQPHNGTNISSGAHGGGQGGGEPLNGPGTLPAPVIVLPDLSDLGSEASATLEWRKERSHSRRRGESSRRERSGLAPTRRCGIYIFPLELTSDG